MTFDPTSVEVTCVTLPKDHCVHVPWEYTYVCGYSDQFCELSNKGHWPTSVEVLCVTLPKDHCVQVPWKYIKVCGHSDPFCKNLNQRSLTPRWSLTPHLLRSHVWLYPRIIVSKSHENTSKYVDTVNLSANTWTKGHWPLNDLWPHMHDSTQGSLCLKSHGNTSMYVDTVINFANYHIHTNIYYILRTESVITSLPELRSGETKSQLHHPLKS